MRKAIDYMKTHPIFTGTLGVALCVTAIKVLNPDGRLFAMALFRLLIIFAMSMFVYLISGTKSFEKCHSTTGYELKWNLPILITSLLFSFMVLISILMGVLSVAEDWPVRLAGAACLFSTVGLVEELTFRVIINDAILYRFRNSKHVFVWIAIISSFVFGVVHVIGADILASPMSVTTSVLKTVSTGLAGFCWLILYWKTRNVFGIAIAHSLFDFFSGAAGLLISETTEVGGAQTYVGVGGNGAIFYVVMVIIDIIIARFLWKHVGRTIDFEEIRRTW